MKRTTLRDGIIQVLVEDGSISIEKCESCDNFDDHGCDWSLPLDDIDEAKELIKLLQQAVHVAEIDQEADELGG
jgi:hypothetical protein